jgi:hypothetical protein
MFLNVYLKDWKCNFGYTTSKSIFLEHSLILTVETTTLGSDPKNNKYNVIRQCQIHNVQQHVDDVTT